MRVARGLDRCDVLINWGNNPAEMHPVLFSRVLDRKARGETVVIIDMETRRTRSSDLADHFICFQPHGDLAIANGIAHLLLENGTWDRDFVERHCSGDLLFEPGSRFAYNNSGYFLLGAMIEAIRGQTYEQALQELILMPFGLEDTGYEWNERVIERRASGYKRVAGGALRLADRAEEGVDHGDVVNVVRVVGRAWLHASNGLWLPKQIGDDQLFYLMSRGLTEEEATAMIVAGFIEPIVKELPMEYAVELNRLIELQMEGSVG